MTGITVFSTTGESKELEYLSKQERNNLLSGLPKEALILWIHLLCGLIVGYEAKINNL